MSLGQFARRLLGDGFQPFGEAYRRCFVDMPRVAGWMAPHLPRNARVLDIGGGDGYVVGLLLDLRPDISVTMTDLAPLIGGFLTQAQLARVTLCPETPVSAINGAFDTITITDVIHHVRPAERRRFLAEVGEAAKRVGCSRVMVKDVEPGGFRAKLAELGDRYITGDRHVRFLSYRAVSIPGYRKQEAVFPDYPNYCLRFEPVS